MTLFKIAEFCDGTLVGDGNVNINHYSTDTRTINVGDLYIPLKGENFDGHKFINAAFKNGAVAALCSDKTLNFEQPIIYVDNTLKALQKLANKLREELTIPVIGVTGSVGKTSTRDMIGTVVSSHFKTLKTEGNLNNHIGLPLTMLKYKNEEAMVLEMGMNHSGEISTLASISKPNIAVITNIGSAHIGNLGSFENILKAKLEITDYFDENNILIINNDNKYLNRFLKENKNKLKYKIKTFGIKNRSNVYAANMQLNETGSSFDYKGYHFVVNVPGEHFVLNALSAIAAGECLNIPYEKMQAAIAAFELTKGRLDLIHLNNIDIIDGSYNANYDSMKSSLNVLGKYKQRKVAILADMLELGSFSKSLHKQVGELVCKNNIDVLLCVGDQSKHIYDGAINHKDKIWYCNNNVLIEDLQYVIKPNDIILIKGSNGMKLVEVINYLKNNC